MLPKIMTVMQRGGGQALRRARIGAIFIEFTIVIPVLIAILYYIHDVPKAKRIKSEVEFCANCAVNLLQNNGRRVTIADLTNISCIAFLPHFGGGEKQYSFENNRKVWKYSSVIALFYLVGTGHNTAKIKWYAGQNGLQNPRGGRSFWVVKSGTVNSWTSFAAELLLNNDYHTSKIMDGLTINAGEVKMVLYASLYIATFCLMSDGKNIKSTPSLWNFLVLNPRAEHIRDLSHYVYFDNAVVFTPKSGLFSEIPPQ
ncbi:MAG: hypothetical protein LBB21_02275 [Holosporaceae bacterium]|jgi:hypothetical protein|nr:hypothetical protein [Holosporaceae bacterium]